MSCHERPLLCCWSCCYCTKLSSVVLCLVHITFLTKNARRHFFLPSIECQDTPTKNPLPPSTDSTNSRKEENNNANNSQPASIYIELLVSTFLSKYFSFDFICAFEVFVWSSLFFYCVLLDSREISVKFLLSISLLGCLVRWCEMLCIESSRGCEIETWLGTATTTTTRKTTQANEHSFRVCKCFAANSIDWCLTSHIYYVEIFL